MELEDYGVFIKLVEEEYVEDILNGNLHFSSLKSFSIVRDDIYILITLINT